MDPRLKVWSVDQCKKRIMKYTEEYGDAESFWDFFSREFDIVCEDRADWQGVDDWIAQCHNNMTKAWDELFPAEKPTEAQECVYTDDPFAALDDPFVALDGEVA